MQTITEAECVLRQNKEAFRQLKDNLLRKGGICIAAGGGYFENLL